MVYHIQRVLRFWITPLQLPSVHWNSRHSGLSERRWAKFCVERLGLLTSKLTSSSTRVHNGTPHSSRVMRYCSSGTPMSHFSWSNYHFSGIFLVGSGPVVFVSCTSFFILLLTGLPWPQSSARRPPSYYFAAALPSEVKLSLKRAVAVAIFISILSASSSFGLIKAGGYSQDPGISESGISVYKITSKYCVQRIYL